MLASFWCSFLHRRESWTRLTDKILNPGGKNHNIPVEFCSLQGATLIPPLSHLAYRRGVGGPPQWKAKGRSLYLQKPEMPKVLNTTFHSGLAFTMDQNSEYNNNRLACLA